MYPGDPGDPGDTRIQRWASFFEQTKFLTMNEIFRGKSCRLEKTNDERIKWIAKRNEKKTLRKELRLCNKL